MGILKWIIEEEQILLTIGRNLWAFEEIEKERNIERRKRYRREEDPKRREKNPERRERPWEKRKRDLKRRERECLWFWVREKKEKF